MKTTQNSGVKVEIYSNFVWVAFELGTEFDALYIGFF